jgi:UDP-N-acetylmuramoyl-tripeptide--D-alanyl-D-alanine ligase
MNPGSARAALQAFAGLQGSFRRVVVFGDMLELGDASERLHAAVGAAVAKSNCAVFVAVGARARTMADGALGAGMERHQVVAVESVAAAVDALFAVLHEGDRILVKASRAMRLDRLVDRVAAQFDGSSPGANDARVNGSGQADRSSGVPDSTAGGPA